VDYIFSTGLNFFVVLYIRILLDDVYSKKQKNQTQKNQTMDRQKIEEKDQRVTNKVREIFHNKEQARVNRGHVWQTYRLWLTVVCAGLVLAGLTISREQPATVVSNNSEPTPGDASNNGDASVVEKPTDQMAATDASDSGESTASPETAGLLSAKDTDPPETEVLSREARLTEPQVPSDTDRSTEAVAADQPRVTGQKRKTSHITISKIVSCSTVSKLKYVHPKKVFSLKKDSTPTVWMRVLSDKPPFTLSHVYYLNGKRYCRVPLKIRYRQMRTWSNVTLNRAWQCGKWRVDVTTKDGEILEQIEFTVVP